jgi:hypothetical protein
MPGFVYLVPACLVLLWLGGVLIGTCLVEMTFNSGPGVWPFFLSNLQLGMVKNLASTALPM